MFDQECINEALHALVLKCNYKIKKIDYEEKHFGNFIIELVEEDLFNIRFISDRGQLWCEISHGSDWLLLNDIFEAIRVSFSYIMDDDYCKNIEVISKAVHQNLDALIKALDKDNYRVILYKIEEIKQKRVEALLKKFNDV